MLFLSIIFFIIILGVLIFLHEFSHFISAKRAKVKVEEFCIGFPPKIFKVRKGETIYSLGLFPFGGFVKIFGEESREEKPGSFFEKSVGTRARIISAGVIANFLLAFILFSIGFHFGLPQQIQGKVPEGAKEVGISIVGIAQNSPAEKAKIKIGDKIIKIRNPKLAIQKDIKEAEDVQNITRKSLGQELILTLKRGNKLLEKKVTPRENPPESEGPIGIALIKTGRVPYHWPKAILKGARSIFSLAGMTIKALFEITKGAILGKRVEEVELAGPIGIFPLFSQMIELGWIYVLQFTAILSLNLAILNIFPFPALDGGRLLFLLIEKIRKAPLKIEIENLVNRIGFAILIILMIIITFRDIKRLFG